MKKMLLFIVLLSQIYGCAAGLQPYPQSAELFPDGQTLWQVRLGRGGSQFFAGLLALNKKEDSLEAVLLDSTGIKLLEEKVLSSGQVEVVSVLPAVRNKRLAPFLGKGLFRLFFSPTGLSDEPCRRDGLFELCLGTEDDGHLVKFRRLGPFVLWSVDYFINNHGSGPLVTEARLNAGWFAPYLQLERSGAEPGQ
jgi:hypothetical protein